MPVDLAPELLEILACPNCHSALAVDDDRDELVCVASDCGLAYPVVGGIPVMLVDEARRPGTSTTRPLDGEGDDSNANANAGGAFDADARESSETSDDTDRPGAPGSASSDQ